MGSEFLNSKQFQRALEENPEQITWSSLREVVLQRGNTGKLGFKFHTFQVKLSVIAYEERSGSVVECLTQDQGVAGSSGSLPK